MIRFSDRKKMSACLMMLTAAFALSSSGCIGTMAQILYVIKGHNIPAAYDGLSEKRVAVVCVSEASAYGPDTLSYTVSKALGMKLAQSVKKMKLIPHAAVEDWIDKNGWDEIDFAALGRGVGADRVVAVEIGSYSIHEGPTLYKGRAHVAVTVHDLEAKNGPEIAFVYGPEDYAFPENGRPSIQSSDRKFEAFFLSQLIQRIANQFVKHDKLASFADDARDY